MAGVAPNVKPHPEWRVMVEQYADADYGTRITHEDLARVAQLKYGSRRYYGQVSRWITVMLREHHKAIAMVKGIGYEIVMPDRFTEESRKSFLQGKKRIKRGVLKGVVAPVDKMSPEQSQKHANHLAWMSPVMRVLNKIERNTRPAMLEKARPDFPRLKA